MDEKSDSGWNCSLSGYCMETTDQSIQTEAVSIGETEAATDVSAQMNTAFQTNSLGPGYAGPALPAPVSAALPPSLIRPRMRDCGVQTRAMFDFKPRPRRKKNAADVEPLDTTVATPSSEKPSDARFVRLHHFTSFNGKSQK